MDSEGLYLPPRDIVVGYMDTGTEYGAVDNCLMYGRVIDKGKVIDIGLEFETGLHDGHVQASGGHRLDRPLRILRPTRTKEGCKQDRP